MSTGWRRGYDNLPWDLAARGGSDFVEPLESAAVNRCRKCALQLHGSFVDAQGERYHSDCFTCAACRDVIPGTYFQGDDGGFLCGACREARGPRCAACRGPIRGKCTTAKGRVYHHECFRCARCQQAISGSYLQEGLVFLCAPCHEIVHPPETCGICRQAIKGQVFRDEGQSFHPRCCSCDNCGQPIEGKCFTGNTGTGRVCATCQPRCCACGGPLAGRKSFKVDDRRLHTDCFRCCECMEAIEANYFEVPPTNPFQQDKKTKHRCANCHKKVLQRREDDVSAVAVDEEDQRKKRDAADYKLFWRPEIVPSSRLALRDFGLPDHMLPQNGPICVCLDNSSGRVSCGPVARGCAEAAVSLPYLACMLRVLRDYGREPQFSLDPKDPRDLGGPYLVKRFFPDWLAGTVVGEVLFQADYALKQLCFGDQRLLGIPSVFDENGWYQGGDGEQLAARQWFTVRRAGVTVTADGVFVPHVQMGVEARRLTKCTTGYKDAAFTEPSDPMVRQAAAVSERFHEVAARLPAARELFELARAAVLAIHLLSRGCQRNDAALDKYRMPSIPEGKAYPLQIPTLSKERRAASVVSRDTGQGGEEIYVKTRARSMRGGVDLSVPRKGKVPVEAVKAKVLDPVTRLVPLPFFLPAAAARAA